MDRERELFVHYIKTELNLSSSTIDGYSRDIRQFSMFLQKKGIINWLSCSQALISAYIDYLKELGTSPSSLQRKISAIRRFCKYLKKYRQFNLGLFKPLTAIQNDNTPVLLHQGEITRLLSAPDLKTEKGIRDRAMLELLCATGIKVSELINLDVSDIMLENTAIRCRRGNEMRIISIRLSVKKHLRKYLVQSRNTMLSNINEDAFFLNMSGERLTRQGLNKIINGYAEGLHLKNRITPNALRCTFAHRLSQNGLSVEAIQDIMGHSDLSTTKALLKSCEKQRIKNK